MTSRHAHAQASADAQVADDDLTDVELTALAQDVTHDWGRAERLHETDSAQVVALNRPDLTVAVVGLGYVGLPTALGVHAAGMRVVGLDVSAARLEAIRSGRPDLLDSDLRALQRARRDPDGFRIADGPSVTAQADCLLICVPTPVDSRQSPDLGPLRAACAAAVRHARGGQTLILTSTTYVGCTRELLVDPLAERGLIAGEDVFVCFAPERIDPGNQRFGQNDVPRVIGGVTEACAESAARVLTGISARLHFVSSPEAAEMTKLLENTFRAVNIAFANEFAEASRLLGLDPIEVIDAAATKPYGFMPFYPGPGVGGHCIPCDPHYLLAQLRDQRVYPPVVSAAMEGIATRPARIVQRAAETLESAAKPLRGSRVLVIGLSYKRNVADLRHSPALEIIAGLRGRGAEVSVYDPLVDPASLGPPVDTLVDEPGDMASYDLVLVACRHDLIADELVARAGLVLDATYSLPSAENCHVP